MHRKETGSPVGRESINLRAIKEYGKTGYKLKELLEDCRKQDVKIVFDDTTVEAGWMADVYEMIIDRVQEELKIEQRAGIRRALERKKQGIGSYGRPRIVLPENFEQELKKRIDNKESLASYCEEIHMKKSTFYKWARIYQNSWNLKEDKQEHVLRRSTEMDVHRI